MWTGSVLGCRGSGVIGMTSPVSTRPQKYISWLSGAAMLTAVHKVPSTFAMCIAHRMPKRMGAYSASLSCDIQTNFLSGVSKYFFAASLPISAILMRTVKDL